MSTVKQWEKKINEYVAEIAKDEDLGDEEFIEVLEHLGERAEELVVAKREEMAENEDDDDDDDDDDEVEDDVEGNDDDDDEDEDEKED